MCFLLRTPTNCWFINSLLSPPPLLVSPQCFGLGPRVPCSASQWQGSLRPPPFPFGSPLAPTERDDRQGVINLDRGKTLLRYYAQLLLQTAPSAPTAPKKNCTLPSSQ